MIKLKAYFNDGEYETYLPLTEKSDKEISDKMYGIDYLSIETDLEICEDDLQFASDYINECYDLIDAHDISKYMLNWGVEEFKAYLDMIEGIAKDTKLLKWGDREYYDFIGKFE